MITRYTHGRDLRTIGQQLDKLGIDNFDLRYQDGDYLLECGDPNPPFTNLLHFSYSNFDLRSLELNAAQSRSEKFNLVNFDSLSELLRSVGRNLEKQEAKLARIQTIDFDMNGGRFLIEYEGRDGRYHRVESPTHEIAELARRMYKERSGAKASSHETMFSFR